MALGTLKKARIVAANVFTKRAGTSGARSRMGRLSPEWLRRLYAEHAPAGSRRRLVADGMVLGVLTLVLFMVLLLGVERLTDLGPVRRIRHVFQGTFSPGTSADYSSQVVPKIAPVRPAATSSGGTGNSTSGAR